MLLQARGRGHRPGAERVRTQRQRTGPFLGHTVALGSGDTLLGSGAQFRCTEGGQGAEVGGRGQGWNSALSPQVQSPTPGE